MSRAFLKDDDGWKFCREKNRECMLAEADGSCSIHRCRYERRPPAETADHGDGQN